jgi:hypothetical protein
MPVLPSGRKVLVEPRPLVWLLEHTEIPGNIGKILGINSIPKLMEWCEVAYYVEADEEHDDDILIVISENSLPPPPGHFLKRTDCLLSDWKILANDWSEADRFAFEIELQGDRFQEYLASQMALVNEIQKQLLSSDDPLIQVIVEICMASSANKRTGRVG